MFASSGGQANVSFFSRATPPAKAEKPKKAKLMIMGSLAGLALGIILPLLYEMIFHRRVRCRDDIEREFGLAVLSEFGPIPSGVDAP
jgi:succinoglycan biosynthesis transport protein ExoP